jgi:amphi-Trp domain-containing protein
MDFTPDQTAHESQGRQREQPSPASAFAHVALHNRAEVPAYLDALSECFRAGRLVLSSGDEEFRAEPAELVRVKLDAERSEEVVHVTIRLSWSESSSAAFSAAPLSINPGRR